MRQIKNTIIILVCLLVFFSCTAKGETCYVALRQLMSGDDSDMEDWYLGEGDSYSFDAGDTIFAVYAEDEEEFYIIGENEYGDGEITIWEDIDLIHGYYMIYKLCNIWEPLQKYIDQRHSITFAITGMEDVEDDWLIYDAETAADFVTIMDKTLSALTDDD